MGATGGETSAAVVIIAAMVTPALLILASASLVATALVRMARVVDRARFLATIAHEGAWAKIDATPEQLRKMLKRHARRARLAEWSIALLYTAVVVFVGTCISIVIDHEVAHSLSWLPVGLAITGTFGRSSKTCGMSGPQSATRSWRTLITPPARV